MVKLDVKGFMGNTKSENSKSEIRRHQNYTSKYLKFPKKKHFTVEFLHDYWLLNSKSLPSATE